MIIDKWGFLENKINRFCKNPLNTNSSPIAGRIAKISILINKSGKEGEILDKDLTIGCSRNSIKIILIQKEGKKILNVKDFLAGYKIKKGDVLSWSTII